MSAFKKLKSTDAFVTTYVAKKSWHITGSDVGNYGIQVLYGLTASNAAFFESDDTEYGPSDSGISGQGSWFRKLVYRSINQLYYSNYNNTNGSIIEPEFLTQAISGSSVTTIYTASVKLFDNHEETSLTYVESATNGTSGSRYLSSFVTVFSLPREVIGTHIEPNTFNMVPQYDAAIVGEYVEDTYVEDGYYVTEAEGSSGYLGGLPAIYDDGEGNLRARSTSYVDTIVGNIIYSHGLIILTNLDVAAYYRDNPTLDNIRWKSNQPIYTYNYHAKISDYEYNHSLNPTALTGSDNRLRDNVSGSSFQPYITSVGMYNDANELIAIAKMSQPLVKPADTELTIQVKLDI